MPQNNKIKSKIKIDMKISELIKKLQKVQEEHGDVEVLVYDSVYFDATKESFYVDKDNKLYIRG